MSAPRASRPSTLVACAFFLGLVLPAGIPGVLSPLVVGTGVVGLAVCLISTIVGRLRSRAAEQRACWKAERRLAYRLHRHVPIQPPNRRVRRAARFSNESQYLPVTQRSR
jgi:hypothetical protein